MKSKIIACAVAAVAAYVTVGAPTMHPYELPASAASRDQAMGCLKADEIVAAGGKLELGKWYTDFTTCKKYCDDNGIPLFAIWSNASCVHCWYTDICFVDEKFKEWAATHDAGKVIYCFMAGGEKGCPDQSGSTAYNWMWKTGGTPKLSAYPFVVLWWEKGGVNYRTTGDNLCKYANGGTPTNFMTDSSVPERIDNIVEKMEAQFKDWHPTPEVSYAGGHFTQTNYPYASLQAEKATKYVDVEIVRDSLVATNQVLKIEAPGKASATVTIAWELGQTAQTNRVADFDTKWFAKGKDVTLSLLDGGETMSTVTVACVEMEISAANPKWGTSGQKDTVEFGEWTMDLAAAKAKVANTPGAHTLVCVQGSLWCPDCGNVEANFLGLKDAAGNNRFEAWAKENNIALVSIDIPNFKSTGVEAESPCLLKKEAYLTSPDGTRAMHSGLGYLTRNMVSDADAAAILARNHDLASKNTYEGGFHRPEDGNAYRTGVPIFVMLDKYGAVKARLTRMAAKSPSAEEGAANFDNYIRRFEEMLTIADNNATEIENNYPSASNALTLKANGGTESATLSHTDTADVFRLDGIGGNALQSVTVRGESAAEVIVSLVTTNADGSVSSLKASGVQKLSDGISIEHTFEKAGSYYVKIEAADVTSAPFALESAESTFQSYTVSGSVVLVPQEDKATARPAAGSDKVTIKLTEGTRYYITGMASCANLAAVDGAPAGFYVATQGGNAELTLDKVDGEVSYQVWNSGTVEFVATAREVTESVCDLDGTPLEIAVRRQDGKSGTVRMTVSVDPERTTLASERYWLVGTNAVGSVDVDWADGETGTKTVRLYVDDDLLYTGTAKVTLTAAVTSQVGDVKAVSGKDLFELTVTEDDIQDPGTAYFTRTEPGYARQNMVIARQGEGANIWATRVDGSDGLVAGILTSSEKGTQFKTENDRDLEKLSDVAPELAKRYPKLSDAQVLYWSASEAGEKCVRVSGIPAGKTAKIVFEPVGDLKTIAASNTVLVSSVADDAPAFGQTEYAENEFMRYVARTERFAVTGLKKDGKVTFRKVSGKLPAGLSVGFARSDDATGEMTISGAATAKSGTYEAVYQVCETRDGELVSGLAARFVITLLDPITEGTGGSSESSPVRKTRTFTNVPVFDAANQRMVGVLTLTIPPTGRLSAKFSGTGGTTSYASAAWTGYSMAGDGWELEASLAPSRGDSAVMGVIAYSQGGFAAQITGDGYNYVAESDGRLWTKAAPATDWKGYYTVALRHKKVLSEDKEGIAPTGDGYLTLKMTSSSACQKGAFTVAGVLANGQRVSCSSTLGLSGGKAYLPVFKSSSRDILSVALGIAAKAQESENRRCVESPSLYDGYWAHTESEDAANDYEVGFTAHGSYYDSTEDLGGCCAEYYETNELNFRVDGEIGAGIRVEDDTIILNPDKENTYEVKLTFKRATGVVTGSFLHPNLGTRVSYSGVVVNGWGEGCGCGTGEEVYLPFMSGAYQYGSGAASRRKGGEAAIDK